MKNSGSYTWAITVLYIPKNLAQRDKEKYKYSQQYSLVYIYPVNVMHGSIPPVTIPPLRATPGTSRTSPALMAPGGGELNEAVCAVFSLRGGNR